MIIARHYPHMVQLFGGEPKPQWRCIQGKGLVGDKQFLGIEFFSQTQAEDAAYCGSVATLASSMMFQLNALRYANNPLNTVKEKTYRMAGDLQDRLFAIGDARELVYHLGNAFEFWQAIKADILPILSKEETVKLEAMLAIWKQELRHILDNVIVLRHTADLALEQYHAIMNGTEGLNE
jgi:hypothetical protein